MFAKCSLNQCLIHNLDNLERSIRRCKMVANRALPILVFTDRTTGGDIKCTWSACIHCVLVLHRYHADISRSYLKREVKSL